jgi:hypothetical protein
MLTLPVKLIWHTLFLVPHIALESAMACRVFRSLRLGLIWDADGGTTQFSTQQPPLHAVMASADVVHGSGNSHHRPIVVEISHIAESIEPKSHPVDNQKWEDDNPEVNLNCV